ncbi:MAG: hypothetical protein KJZ70_02140 [Bryobacterales bacterium]|nr:hypothetical protein [Bryobacterales bacterium]
MKGILLWLIMIEMITGVAAMAAPAKVTLRGVVKASSDIVVGDIIQRRRVWRIPHDISPNYPYPSKPQYLCKFDIAVDHVLYSSVIRVGSQISVLMFDFYANCSGPGRSDNPPKPSTFIWFLRRSGTAMRPTYDSHPAVKAIGRPTADDIRYAVTFPEKEARVGFLLLQKGIVSQLTGYEDHIFSSDGDVQAMCGMRCYLQIRELQYRTDSSDEMRSQIDILLSPLGMCIDRARIAVEQYKVPIEPRYSLLVPAKWEYWQEVRLRELSGWQDLPEPESAFERPELDGWLVVLSCSSSRRVREKARSVIRRLGRDDLRSIQCVPCE